MVEEGVVVVVNNLPVDRGVGEEVANSLPVDKGVEVVVNNPQAGKAAVGVDSSLQVDKGEAEEEEAAASSLPAGKAEEVVVEVVSNLPEVEVEEEAAGVVAASSLPVDKVAVEEDEEADLSQHR